MEVKIKCEVILTEDVIRLIPISELGHRDMNHQFGIPRNATPSQANVVFETLPKWIADVFMELAKKALSKAKAV